MERRSESSSRARPTVVLSTVLTALALVPWIVRQGGDPSSDLFRACGVAAVVLLLGFVAELILAGIAMRSLRRFARERTFELIAHSGLLVALIDLFLGGSLLGLRGASGAIAAIELDLAVMFLHRIVRLFRLLARRQAHFARVLVVSFVVIIIAGTLMLWLLPGTRVPEREPLTFLDALFTSTSATCVTGLVVHDTGAQFSSFGQAILLLLIQVGGLGIMTFAAFFAMALGQGFGLRDRALMRDVLNVEVLGRITRILVAIVAITLLVEAVGAALLYGRLEGLVPDDRRAWYAVFHSVSAFCNAGFALLGPDSLTACRADALVNGVVMAEIVLGGLGFVVILDLLGFLPGGRRILRGMTGRGEETGPRRLTVQTRIVLFTSLVLVVAGAVLFWLLERGNPATLGSLPAGERFGAALFQSVTARTAGFNTVDSGAVRPPGALLTMFLMFVGASPGSTGGGLKTVTLVVVLVTVLSFARGRERPELMGRSIPFLLISRAVVILTCYASLIVATLLILTITEEGTAFLPLAFETVSAFGTVGLSMGVTPGLSEAGKVVVALAMLVGRIGPMTLVVAMAQRRPRPAYDFPEARLMIG